MTRKKQTDNRPNEGTHRVSRTYSSAGARTGALRDCHKSLRLYRTGVLATDQLAVTQRSQSAVRDATVETTAAKRA